MKPEIEAGFEPARSGTVATSFECGLCGLVFSHGERVCASCVIGADCSLVRCPRCGYQFPRPTSLGMFLTRIMGRLGGRA